MGNGASRLVAATTPPRVSHELRACRVGRLPDAERVLAVCAHPDDESFGLGGILGTYADLGVDVAVLCQTQCGSSTLGAAQHDLAVERATELAAASAELGVGHSWLLDYPDGGLDGEPVERLAEEVHRTADEHRPDLLVAFHLDGVTGHGDHRQATRAAVDAAEQRGLPLWGWYVPARVAAILNREFGAAFVGTAPEPGDLVVTVDRHRQRRAIVRHGSQQASLGLVERRLELLGAVEHMRCLASGSPTDQLLPKV